MYLFGVLHAESMISIRKHSLPEPVRQPVSTRSDRGLPDGTSRSNCAEYQPPIPRRFDPAQPRVKYRRRWCNFLKLMPLLQFARASRSTSAAFMAAQRARLLAISGNQLRSRHPARVVIAARSRNSYNRRSLRLMAVRPFCTAISGSQSTSTKGALVL